MTLDANSTVWNFRNWRRPFQLVSPSLDCSSPDTTPVQVECGGEFSAALMKSGGVYVWWASEGILGRRYENGMAELGRYENVMAEQGKYEYINALNDGTVIHCLTWEIDENPVKLPPLPDLPDLIGTGLAEEERQEETKLIKIAAFDVSLIGLTNKGHVLKLDGLYNGGYSVIWRYVRMSAQTVLCCTQTVIHSCQTFLR